jgi:hypothetical protein
MIRWPLKEFDPDLAFLKRLRIAREFLFDEVSEQRAYPASIPEDTARQTALQLAADGAGVHVTHSKRVYRSASTPAFGHTSLRYKWFAHAGV